MNEQDRRRETARSIRRWISLGLFLVAAASTAAPAKPSSPCDQKWVIAGDVSGILRLPIVTAKNVPGDAQSCEFKTESFPAIQVTFRPGLGKITVETWAAGKMPSKATPLVGVGDRAVWVDDLHEVDAQKDNALCVVTANGAGRDFAIGKSELQKRLGGLCNQIFSRVRR
jgi:hypothetical protein